MREMRNYSAGDEIAIMELFEHCFHKKMSLEYWKWRFTENPCGKMMIKLLWDEERLIGHYAVSPVMLNVEGQSIFSALSMTTMTHSEYAGQGIFTELATELYESEYRENDLKLVWGFPNTNSHYGFVKNLNWVDLEQIPLLSLEVASMKKAASAVFSVVEKFGQDHFLGWKALLPSNSWGVERSVEYLNWRYTDNPINEYSIFELKQGQNTYFAVVKIVASFSDRSRLELDILELCVPPEFELLEQLLHTLLLYFENKNLGKINVWIPLKNKKHILMERLGFKNSLPITYAGMRILDARYKEVIQSSSWNYSMGDSDIF